MSEEMRNQIRHLKTDIGRLRAIIQGSEQRIAVLQSEREKLRSLVASVYSDACIEARCGGSRECPFCEMREAITIEAMFKAEKS